MSKWESEADMNAELRRIAHDTRQLKEELQGFLLPRLAVPVRENQTYPAPSMLPRQR